MGRHRVVPLDSEEDIERVFGMDSEELKDLVIDAYLREYPGSRSAALPRMELEAWTAEELDELFGVMSGETARPRESLVFSGDIVKGESLAFAPLENFIETKAFVGRTLALQVWRAHEGTPRSAQETIAVIEAATLEIVRANLMYYVEHRLVPGSLMAGWTEAREGERAVSGAGESELPSGLSGREVQVAVLAAEGLTNGEIAARLGIAQNTVKNHLARLYAKTGTANRTELARWAMERGL